MIFRVGILFTILCLTIFSTPAISQDLDSVIDSSPTTDDTASTTITATGPGINWDEIIFDEPLTAAQLFASQTTDLQLQGFSEGLSPFGILIQIIRQLTQNFGAPPVSPIPGPASSTPSVTPIPPTGTGTAVASSASPVTPGPGAQGGSEDDYAQRAQTIIDELKAQGAKPGMGIGDSPAKLQIGGFPSWFGELQSLIVGRRSWGELEERGRRLLGEYAATWSRANIPQPTPHGLTEFFKYLGCCETNDEAIRNYDASLPRSGDFFGSKGGVNWCAFA
ncbi:MAG TPA: hypothetical protein PKO06_07295, partial [Candidatus Ozemobacteraceae bacterium]|nr:hypothetical protein [Candidatus Ozemobacteraceae bacterium]